MPIRKPASKQTFKDKLLTKEQIIATLQESAHKLGHAPNGLEFRQVSGITKFKVGRHFDSFHAALRAAGLTPNQKGTRIEARALMEDWGKVARKVGGVPTRTEYLREGSYSLECLVNRAQKWSRVPQEFSRFVAAGGLSGDWTDVLEMIEHGFIPTWRGPNGLAKMREAVRLAYEAQAKEPPPTTDALAPNKAELRQHVATTETRQQAVNPANPQILPPPLWGKKCVTATMLAVFIAELAPSGLQWITAACFQRRPLKDRPLLGAPTGLPAFPYEPVNEMGVMVLFSMMAERLGFVVESVQAGFPDCEAKIEVEPGRWQHFRIEFEFESRGFKQHGHNERQCDLIVCWRHNWKGCPANLQVLELSQLVGKLTADKRG
jgi:hypothetical protein